MWWLEMWADVAGISRSRAGELRAAVYGGGGHRPLAVAAESEAPRHIARGAAMAWPTVARWATDAGMDLRGLAEGLGAPAHCLMADDVAKSTAGWATSRWRDIEAAREAAVNGGERRFEGLLSAALRAIDPELAPRLMVGKWEARYFIRRMLGVADAVDCGLQGGDACRLCNNRRTIGSSSSDAWAADHVLSCKRAGPMAGAKARHDEVVRGLVRLANRCGCEAKYHDGPVFDTGKKRRPADWLECDGRRMAGVCHDLTIGAADVMTAAAREKKKSEKYAGQMAQHPHLGFCACAVTLDGVMGPQAEGIVARWAQSRAVVLARGGYYCGDVAGAVRDAVGRIFLTACARQLREWRAVVTRARVRAGALVARAP